ncbi:MAG: Gfo/Idh/MocA family oxidoreductase [Gemmatimonadota bacterium]|nr:Gfo/Idh/MocA family oxidoreductase [Gemmatimonadota bacterium]
MPSYRAALIGCGNISGRHARAYLAQGNVELVAACDINPENLNRTCDELEIPGRYASHQDLFKHEAGIDLVSVCTFPNVHGEQTIAAANAGAKGVLCEKPMCLSLDEADGMIRACRRNDTRLVIAHRHRQSPNFNKARRLIAGGAIGEPRLVWSYLTSCLVDNGTHIVDMMRYLLGDPEADWVMGQASRKRDTLYQGSPAEESSVGLVAFRTGTRAVVEMGERTPKDGFRFRVLGSEGTIDAALDEVVLTDGNGITTFREEPRPGFMEQTREMIAWVEGGPEHRSSERQGRAATELLMAMHESARTGELIELPLKIGYDPMKKRVEEAVSRQRSAVS